MDFYFRAELTAYHSVGWLAGWLGDVKTINQTWRLVITTVPTLSQCLSVISISGQSSVSSAEPKPSVDDWKDERNKTTSRYPFIRQVPASLLMKIISMKYFSNYLWDLQPFKWVSVVSVNDLDELIILNILTCKNL